VQFGYHLTPFWSPADRRPVEILDEAIAVVRGSAGLGYRWVSMGQHWLSYPTVWPQPFPFLARLAPETGSMLLKTSVLLLPLFNPVDVAENVATLDNIAHGRLVLGVSIGYRDAELRAAGLGRADRVPRLEESLEVMRRLWRGEEVTFTGRTTHLERARLGLLPYQRPHPPIEFGAQSEGATRRAARLGDGVMFGPQVGWRDVGRLARVYRAARAESGNAGPGQVLASRCLMVGTSKEDAAARARRYLERTFAMYSAWSMQEATMVPLRLDFERGLDEWTICGSAADCVETIARARDEIGLDGIGFTIYSLPRSVEERIDYLQMIAEEIVRRV
jgi:alkanesulfonate monooxygenase SsuD/methylene tetrahydromethanopterin reductase-like flavin-dependent oxidoreductase (luciferase family)